MTVSVSLDEGKTWAHDKLIYEGGSTYSDLVVLPDRTIGLLYGKGRPRRGESPAARRRSRWSLRDSTTPG